PGGGVTFLDPLTGIALGEMTGPRLLETHDGGATWTGIPEQLSPGVSVGGAFTFPDREPGWALGSAQRGEQRVQVVLFSGDGGHSWTPVSDAITGQKDAFASLSFVDAHTGYAASGWGHLYVTHDGGESFEPVDLTDSASGNIRFVTPTDGWKIKDFQIY